MADDSKSDTDSLKTILDELFDKLKTDGRDALDKFLELEQEMVGRYQDHLASLARNHEEFQRDFVRMATSAFRNSAEMQAHFRKSMIATQDTLLESHLRFVRHLRESLNKTRPPEEPGNPGRTNKKKAS